WHFTDRIAHEGNRAESVMSEKWTCIVQSTRNFFLDTVITDFRNKGITEEDYFPLYFPTSAPGTKRTDTLA
ncbi:hypothetical protein ACM6T6_005733, partial [Klebsiella pneumoniae]